MRTKVFISWSGVHSKKYGEILKTWIGDVLQSVQPYFSPDDIEKGSSWLSSISSELANTGIGIICLTPDNLNKPWLLFEAGALSTALSGSRVCPILFGVKKSEVQSPLSMFQLTEFGRDEVKKLVETINNQCGEFKLEPTRLDSSFDAWWPELEQSVSKILAAPQSIEKHAERTQQSILEEILDIVRREARDISPAYQLLNFMEQQDRVPGAIINDAMLNDPNLMELYGLGRKIEYEISRRKLEGMSKVLYPKSAASTTHVVPDDLGN